MIHSSLCICCAEFSTAIDQGIVDHDALSGVLCIGNETDCEDGEANDLNLIAALNVAYQGASEQVSLLETLEQDKSTVPSQAQAKQKSASWLFTAKVSDLTIKKAVSMITGDTAIAEQIPDILGGIGMSAVQADCEADSPIAECYLLSVLIAVTSQAVQPDDMPVELQPGLSITARLQMPGDESSSLVTFNMPLSGSAAVYAYGESVHHV